MLPLAKPVGGFGSDDESGPQTLGGDRWQMLVATRGGDKRLKVGTIGVPDSQSGTLTAPCQTLKVQFGSRSLGRGWLSVKFDLCNTARSSHHKGSQLIVYPFSLHVAL